jgi:hypothetical protein
VRESTECHSNYRTQDLGPDHRGFEALSRTYLPDGSFTTPEVQLLSSCIGKLAKTEADVLAICRC